MKKVLGIAVAMAFVFAAYTVWAQATKAPAVNPAVQKVEAAPAAAKPADVKEPKADITDLCKKKGLAGGALDECVKNELAKAEKPAAPLAAKPAEAPKAPATAPVAKPAEAAKPVK